MVNRKAAKGVTNSSIDDDQPDQYRPSQIFYFSYYRYGGCTTFTVTAHFPHATNRKYILCLTKAFEKDIGDKVDTKNW